MKVKLMKVPFFITMIAVLLARIYQFVFINDSIARGNWELIEIALSALAFVSILVMFIFSIRPKGVVFYFSFNKSIFTSIIGILSGIAVIGDSSFKLLKYITESTDIILFLMGIFGIFTGIIFIFLSISFIKGKNLFDNIRIISLIPVIWGILRLLFLFFSYYSTSNKFWFVPDEFAVIFLLSFLFNLAKILADINTPKDLVRLILFGLSAVTFIFIYTTLSFANQTVLNNEILSSGNLTLLMDILIAIFVITIINSVKFEKEKSISQPVEANLKPTNKEISSHSADINMSKIDELVDEIKGEKGIE